MPFVIFFLGKDTQFVFPKVNKINDLLITLFGSICIPEINAGFFSIRSGITVVGEINKLNDIVFVVGFANFENINISLNARFANKQVYRHFNACQKSIVFQNFGVIKEEDDGMCKISFRSKGNYNVEQIAALFGGGGHEKAAGATIKGTVEEVHEIILPHLIKAVEA